MVLPNVHILFTLFIAEWSTTKTITFLLQLIKQLIPRTPGFSDTVVCCKQDQQNKNKAEVEMFICHGSGSGQQPQPEPCINMKHVLFTLKLMQFSQNFTGLGTWRCGLNYVAELGSELCLSCYHQRAEVAKSYAQDSWIPALFMG